MNATESHIALQHLKSILFIYHTNIHPNHHLFIEEDNKLNFDFYDRRLKRVCRELTSIPDDRVYSELLDLYKKQMDSVNTLFQNTHQSDNITITNTLITGINSLLPFIQLVEEREETLIAKSHEKEFLKDSSHL